MMRSLLILLVKGYRLFLSPWLGNSCRFEPTCSRYAIEALEKHGALHGSGLTAWRLLRCQPWCQGGCDPVPEVKQKKQAHHGLFTRLITPQSTSSLKSGADSAKK